VLSHGRFTPRSVALAKAIEPKKPDFVKWLS
jgi:hypothetical protein